MATSAPTSGWSSLVPLVAGQRYNVTVTPGAGGTVRMQWFDGAAWNDFANPAIAATAVLAVPPAAVYLRAAGSSAAGSFDVVAVSGVTTLSATQSARVLTAADRAGALHRAGKPWLRLPAATTGLTAIGSVTLAATTRNNRPCIEITSPASTAVQGVYFALPTAQTVSAFQHVVFEVENAAEFNGGNWRLGFFDGAAGVFSGNGKQMVMTVGTQNGWNGVHCLMPLTIDVTTSGGSTNEWATIGAGAFDSTLMTQCAFRFVRKASPSGTTRIWLYEIAEAEKTSLPQIVIGADDGHLTWYTDGLPLMEKYGFSSYLAFIADDRGTGTRMSQAQWADAIARGHHAVVHGCKTGVDSLRDYFTTYTGYASPQAAMVADITYNRDTMVSEGLDPDGRGRTVYAIPQGYFQPASSAGDDTIAGAIWQAGMLGARRAVVENGIVPCGGWSGAVTYLPVIGHNWANANETTNITNLVSQMQTEVTAGRSVVLMFHEVRAVPSISSQITAANLETILAAAATLVRAGTARAGRLTDLVYETRTYTSPVHLGQ